MRNERNTGTDPSRNSSQQDVWWSENKRGLIAYAAITGAITLPLVGLGIIFSQSTPHVSESLKPAQSPAIDLKTQAPMPSVATAMVLFGS